MECRTSLSTWDNACYGDCIQKRQFHDSVEVAQYDKNMQNEEFKEKKKDKIQRLGVEEEENLGKEDSESAAGGGGGEFG